VLRLTLIEPEIVSAILGGQQPEGMTLTGLIQPFPMDWTEQLGALATNCMAKRDRR
jgi:hypothetical protein